MEIVINSCYGGFGVSINVLKELYKMKSSCIKIVPIKEYFKDYPDKNSIIKFHEHLKIKNNIIMLDDKDDNTIRVNKDLIKIIKKLRKKADGEYAELKIIKIPNNIEWAIEEYDGFEYITEKHRTWN